MNLDLEWFRAHLVDELLPLWLRHAHTSSGLFRCRFDAAWKPHEDRSGTLTSQSRLIYNFSAGFRLTGEERYARALRSGAEFLLEKFRDPEHDGWFFAMSPRGKVLDDTKDSYGHAFMIFALAHAARATGEEHFAAPAREAWELLRTRFSDGRGGIWRKMSRDFLPRDQQKSQNPIMHLFEALLALSEVPGGEDIRNDAAEVADFVLARLLRAEDGVLPELYDQDWRELPADRRGRIDLGHQFEWAFLLSRAAEMGLDPNYCAHAERLLASGMRLGYDGKDGGTFNSAAPDGGPLKGRKGWWQQCELVRALLHFATVRNRDDLREPLIRSLDSFRRDFHDVEHGGWFSSSDGSGDKGGPFKLDYHVVAMCEEAARLAELTN